MGLIRLMLFAILLSVQCSVFHVYAQAPKTVKIGGNVYGGGNKGDVDGNATVTIKGGTLNKVFGGARMADVGGRTFLHVDGEHATTDVFIVEAYGGNDIAGTIGQSGEATTVPTELTGVLTGSETKETNPEKNEIDETWKTFVCTSRSSKIVDGNTVDDKTIVIGSLYGGGNGDFDYEQSEPTDGKVTHSIYNRGDKSTPIAQKVTPEGDVGFQKPEIPKTYLELNGGLIAHAYGGGNNATITENTTISINNHSDDLQTQAISYAAATGTTPQAVLEYLLGMVNLSTFQSNYTSWRYNFARVFGGNNKADMAIRPTWNLQTARIRDLYSGGNQGRMTHKDGLLLVIDPEETNPKPLVIENVYGGCRMADVRPKTDVWDPSLDNPVTGEEGDYADATTVKAEPGYHFPANLAARTLVLGGDIDNVYGGNDIMGKVYFGNAVGVATSIRGDIYGGGNGAYAYTDNGELKNNPNYADYYYEVPSEKTSGEVLLDTRPDAEQVSVMVRGTAEKPTVIGGSIYCGGNCATLEREESHKNLPNYPLTELKIGSYVYAENVYLGNNGTGMVNEDLLKIYKTEYDGYRYNSMDLTDIGQMKTYMKGCEMSQIPRIVTEDTENGDRYTYIPYTSHIGSLFLGGNVGSMTYEGKNTMTLDKPIDIYTKVVGGCNNAIVPEGTYNAMYVGGILGTEAEQETDGYKEGGKIKDRLELNFSGMKVEPKRVNNTYTTITSGTLTEGNEYYTSNIPSRATKFISDGTETATDAHPYYELTSRGTELVWNTAEWNSTIDGFVATGTSGDNPNRRLLDGNVYGGCYNSGIVNGNVIININQNVQDKDVVFDESNVDYEGQRDDLETLSMSVFGAGMGEETEIWGNTTVNLNKGYVFQIFGGGEKGAVGKKNGSGDYVFDTNYCSTVNLNGTKPIYSSDGTDADLAESEYLYGGGNEGDVCGNTYVYLGNGRIYDAFGGASDANVLGHTEVYIGRQPDGAGGIKDGFPWVRDIVYGGNDFGGEITGRHEAGYDFTKLVRDYATIKTKIHGYQEGEVPEVLDAATYVEYHQGRVDTIFGGGYGNYNYRDTETYGVGSKMPYQPSSFVNIRPNTNENNAIKAIFGGGTGYPLNREGDNGQDRSYILIDIPKKNDNYQDNFKKTEVFGAGSYNGVGMGVDPAIASAPATADQASAIIDLWQGQLGNVFGGSYQEGNTRRTVINVPEGSTIKMFTNEPSSEKVDGLSMKLPQQYGNIFGGAYGTQILPPCDVYESNVNYASEDAIVNGCIYGGNNNERRTLRTKVNISSPVWQTQKNGYTGTVFGAGQGKDTWAEYTEVNLLPGAMVYEVYGGSMMGHVLNAESVQQYMKTYKDGPSPDILTSDPDWALRYPGGWSQAWTDAWTLGSYYVPDGTWEDYLGNEAANLSGISNRPELDADPIASMQLPAKKYNANVIINEGATVGNYAYGGGYGKKATSSSDPNYLTGDVYGTTYIALLGGEVKKDIYAAGTAGSVNDLFQAGNFTASANAYILGGTVRNVYGGGWRGSVGFHNGEPLNATANGSDIFGVSNVVIGKKGSNSHTGGNPSVTRNVYGGGEGGGIYGTANVYINNGQIGYRYKNTATGEAPENWEYVPELDDAASGDNLLQKSGNVFGGGYVANSYVDNSNVKMYGGTIRGCLFGGGEIGPIGRGTMKNSQATTEDLGGIYSNGASIFKPGTTHVEIYEGHILRDVFGGGRGKDNWGGEGWMTDSEKLTMDRSAKGYVFGQTAVYIHGGEIGTEEGVAQGYGNVFGGGDMGNVYSAYVIDKTTNGIGKKSGVRYNKGLTAGDAGYDDDGYYYKYEGGSFVTDGGEKLPTEDCKVTIGPNCKVTDPGGIMFTGIYYPEKTVIPAIDLDYMKANSITGYDENGIVTKAGGITFSRSYDQGEYVSTYALHTLKDKTTDTSESGAHQWAKLDDAGIIIHNAVFAGGNISAGEDVMSANTTAVYGNVTAAIHDVYHRDLITIGTGHTGGLYGDGNLTLVDGYRGLNITNYGTDYYNISSEISLESYNALPAREQDYYELKYICVGACIDNEGKSYTPADGSLKASTITADELLVRFEGVNVPGGSTPMLDANGEPDSHYWEANGVCSRYAGRIMNTIQRADFCGVFGSRMVMQGAKDRVPEIADNALYTINRVREVSLNKRESVIAADAGNPKHAMHGNYFGIYNNVKFLGALTSDVFMTDPRTSDATTSDLIADGTTTFVEWKEEHKTDRKRNRAKSYNEVALASGVYLEITTELSTGNSVNEKDWGYVTGVIGLDLINNIQTGAGGGFVYAKNVHGIPTYVRKEHATLSVLNAQAVTRKNFTYLEPDDTPSPDEQEYWETSGNFVHDTQTIIDDCYPISNRYDGPNRVPAHYWYIKGSVYVYDQYISAFTGAPNAYSEVVNIPLTITAASNGKMQLMNVMPNRYAYYANGTTKTKLDGEDILEIRDKEYKLNDPISYWDYNLLSAKEKLLFVEKTYVTIAECEIGETTYPAGYVMLPEEWESLRNDAPTKTIDGESVPAVTSNGRDVAFDYVFRESNNLSHDTGYILTYDVNNPDVWNVWYTPKTDDATGKIKKKDFDELTKLEQENYNNGPTYKPSTAGLYGQHEYKESEIIPKDIYVAYEGEDKNKDGDFEDVGDTKGLKQNPSVTIPADGQAAFEPAWVVTATIDATTDSSKPAHLYPGATIAKSDYESSWASISSSVAPAYVCSSTLELGGGTVIVANTIMTETERQEYITANPSMESIIEEVIQPAYTCTTAGLYGGSYYATSGNYRGLAIWSSMSESDRANFSYNYDALDLLIDPHYSKDPTNHNIIHPEGQKYQYDGNGFTTLDEAKTNKAGYSVEKPVDYTATYEGESNLTYKDKDNNSRTVTVGQELLREDFESLPNEQRHYAPITVPDDGIYNVYVVNSPFIHGETPYAIGQTIGKEDFSGLTSDDLTHVSILEFLQRDAGETFYYCREEYTVNHNGEGQPVKAVVAADGIAVGDVKGNGATVPVGFIISKEGEGVGHTYGYQSLTNRQQNFTIHGVAPVETSTLYVSRKSDIYDLSTEKIITVIYRYDYEELDENGNVAPVSERHVLNIHINFESGVPTIEDITPPQIVLPGTLVQLRTPNVTPGAYEVTGGGWTLFEKEEDSDSHTNGIPYTPGSDPLYWYQNNFWVAYYAQTYLGKTYSNAVQVSVANYHDLAEVMSEQNKTHHMYIDYPYVERDPKIYINNTDGLTQFKDLFDLSVLDGYAVDEDGLITSGDFEGHKPLNTQVRADRNLEFFLHTDLTHEGEWTPIGYDGICDDPSTPADEGKTGQCFDGILHGDGYTINGLDHSLFNHLCGDVYNLGVTGSFTGAGIAETGGGYIENCWINTTGTPDGTVYAIFGNPTAAVSTTKQIVNSYYQDTKTYKTSGGSHGLAIPKPDRAFYNGEVTYDLNGFYLYKRYNDNANPGGELTYKYWKEGESEPVDGTYAANEALCSSGYNNAKYVEDRFADGDFRYAGGTIPNYEDERHWIEEVERNEETIEVDHWSPIWPDDYLFFGQTLNYDQVEDRTHQNVPTAVIRSSGRIEYGETGNRVYRAPAYYRNSIMSVAHFNPYAVFAKNKYGDANVLAYKDMTAIDFTDAKYGLYENYKTYGLGQVDVTIDANTVHTFYPPLLDDCGLSELKLSGFKGGVNDELTKNLLVYTFATGGTGEGETPTAAQQTANVASAALAEPAFAMTNDTYCTVDWADPASIHGHWIRKAGDGYLSERDHLLVDKNDFDAPISYVFNSGKRMWHQREPDNYVDRIKGWEDISLPFSAELVTTQDKGEITHFYNGSDVSKNGTGTKIGHEYWLREIKENSTMTLKSSTPDVLMANFQYPAYDGDGTEKTDKTVTNTFLWDYFYKNEALHNQKDKNDDTYQEYYSSSRKYSGYAMLTRGIPYIIGFPGQTYYEFDLSGNFVAQNTATDNDPMMDAPTKPKQTITFASEEGAHIYVSDTEKTGRKVSYDGKDYYFVPSYLNRAFEAGTNYYTLQSEYDSDSDTYTDCSTYIKVPAASTPPADPVPDTQVSAFRPHFSGPVVASPTKEYRHIRFNHVNDGTLEPDEDISDREKGSLEIYTRGRNIYTVSHLEENIDIRIINASGATLTTYKLEPGKTVITPITAPGSYIVNKKKVYIK
ncbi:MAG: hypothetical protein J6W52_00510 [Bacteroidaceae bacterium]|nr:hypothetical protein [Bacteroidaceae bacterium]